MNEIPKLILYAPMDPALSAGINAYKTFIPQLHAMKLKDHTRGSWSSGPPEADPRIRVPAHDYTRPMTFNYRDDVSIIAFLK